MTNLEALELILDSYDFPYDFVREEIFIPARDYPIFSAMEAHPVTSPEDKAIAIHIYPIPRKRKEGIKIYDSVVEAASALIQYFYKNRG